MSLDRMVIGQVLWIMAASCTQRFEPDASGKSVEFRDATDANSDADDYGLARMNRSIRPAPPPLTAEDLADLTICPRALTAQIEHLQCLTKYVDGCAGRGGGYMVVVNERLATEMTGIVLPECRTKNTAPVEDMVELTLDNEKWGIGFTARTYGASRQRDPHQRALALCDIASCTIPRILLPETRLVLFPRQTRTLPYRAIPE